MKEGVSRLRIHGKDYYAHPGEAFLIPPNVLHDHVTDSDDPTCFMWWDFVYKLYDSIDILCVQNLPIVIRVEDQERFERTFQRFVECSANLRSVSDYIRRESIAFELIAQILEMAMPQADQQYQNELSVSGFANILVDITNAATCKKLLPMLAEKYHLHPTYISNKFKQIYHITPSQYQKQIRMKKAVDLLLGDTVMPINEIAAKLGYEYTADFSRFFKQQYGMSPIQYRNMFCKKLHE